MSDFPKCYAIINKDDVSRSESTSGGAFTLFAASVIQQGGIVCGAKFSDGIRTVSHQCVESFAEVRTLQKSKYVESDISYAIKMCCNALKEGRKVLFVGTPCQVAILHNICGNSEALMTCDLVCHGVPTYKSWASYLSYIEERVGEKAIKVNFRCKRWGWNIPLTKFEFEKGKQWVHLSGIDPYMYAFYRGYSLRSSCLGCATLKNNRPGDLTLGDCWHIGKFSKDMDDNKGTSLVMINTAKGEDFFQSAITQSNAKAKLYSYEIAKENNTALSHPAIVDMEKRILFERMLCRGDNSFWERIIPLNVRIRNYLVSFSKYVLCGLHFPI